MVKYKTQVTDTMDSVINSDRLDSIFTALGHHKRRGVVYTLSLHPATVSQLASAYDMSLPAAHKHIRALEEAKLIVRKKVGRTNFVALHPESLRLVQDWAYQFNTKWSSDDQTLDNYIASMQANNHK